MTWYSDWMRLLKKFTGRTTTATAESFDSSKRSEDSPPSLTPEKDEREQQIEKKLLERVQAEFGPGFKAESMCRCSIQLCSAHDARLRAEIDKRNLSFFLRPEGEDKSGDPYILSLQMFAMEVIERTGPSILRDKSAFCPLCVVRERAEEKDSDAVVRDWVEGAVDVIWQQHHKAGRISDVVQ